MSAEDARLTEVQKRGVQWLMSAHDNGHIGATIALANQLINAETADESQSTDGQRILQAVELYKQASSHPDACFNLGKIYYEGVADILRMDRKEAVKWFKAAASEGDLSAKFFLGHLYRVGELD